MTIPPVRIGALPPIRISTGTLLTILFLALMVFLALPTWHLGTAVSVLIAFAVALFMIVSVLVHELSHALVARAFGSSVDYVALTLWGGHTQYRGGSSSARSSILISLVGPASNGLLALLAAAMRAVSDPLGGVWQFWWFAMFLNIALAVFNLLPGLPMDGGRAVESILGAALRNRVLGTQITAWLGRAIAAIVIGYPLVQLILGRGPTDRTGSLLWLVWAVLIGSILWQGASQALEGARVQSRIDGLDPSALRTTPPLVGPQASLAQADAAARRADAPLESVLVIAPGEDGRGSALRLDPDAAAAVPLDRRETTPVTAVAASAGVLGTLRDGPTGDALFQQMLAHPADLYLVHGDDGRPLGVIRAADVAALLRGR